MIVLGAMIRLAIAMAYVALTSFVAVGAWWTWKRSSAAAWVGRSLAVLALGLLIAPAGCAALYVPITIESGATLKPRLVESLPAAFTASFGAGLLLAVAAIGVTTALKRR